MRSLRDNGQGQWVTSEWEDVYNVYGISFSDASLSRLMTPPPRKEVLENRSRLQNGKRIIRNPAYAKIDERNVSLEMHIAASSRSEFWQRYNNFCDRYLRVGYLEIKHRDITYVDDNNNVQSKVFRMTYVSCEEFTEFRQELARFSLTLNEPDPDNRGVTDSWSSEE